MDNYLEKVIAQGKAKDLAQTREQIKSCFEKVSEAVGCRAQGLSLRYETGVRNG